MAHILAVHSDQRWFRCHQCPLTFNQMRMYTNHARVAHRTSTLVFKCNLCSLSVVGSFDKFYCHVIGKHSSQSFHQGQSTIADSSVSDVTDVGEFHEKTEYADLGSWDSNRAVKEADNVVESTDTDQISNVISCARTRPRPRKRKPVHAQSRRPCPICGKVLSRTYNLQNHMLAAHSNVRLFQCDRCDHACGYYHNLRSHKANVHRLNKEALKTTFLCNLCKKPFDINAGGLSLFHQHILQCHCKEAGHLILDRRANECHEQNVVATPDKSDNSAIMDFFGFIDKVINDNQKDSLDNVSDIMDTDTLPVEEIGNLEKDSIGIQCKICQVTFGHSNVLAQHMLLLHNVS